MNDKTKKILYWIATVLIVLPMGLGGVMEVMGGADMLKDLAHLGYPAYFATMLGIWKLLSVPTLLAPGLARLKEWAYAGIVIDLIAASYSHASVGDGPDKFMVPLVLLGIAMASWALRPEGRKLVG